MDVILEIIACIAIIIGIIISYFTVIIVIIAIAILIIMFFRRNEWIHQSYGVGSKLLAKEKNQIDKLSDGMLVFAQIVLLFSTFAISFIAINEIDNSVFNSFYYAVMASLLIPSIINVLNEKVKTDMFYWIIILVVLALILVFFGQLDIHGDSKLRVYVLALYLAVFVSAIFEIVVEKIKNKRNSCRIYRDLEIGRAHV